MTITPQLLQEVLGLTTEPNILEITNNTIYYYWEAESGGYSTESINLYWFVSQVKKWSAYQENPIVSFFSLERDEWFADLDKYYGKPIIGFYSKEEPEAVINAAQWILDNQTKEQYGTISNKRKKLNETLS